VLETISLPRNSTPIAMIKFILGIVTYESLYFLAKALGLLTLLAIVICHMADLDWLGIILAVIGSALALGCIYLAEFRLL